MPRQTSVAASDLAATHDEALHHPTATTTPPRCAPASSTRRTRKDRSRGRRGSAYPAWVTFLTLSLTGAGSLMLLLTATFTAEPAASPDAAATLGRSHAASRSLLQATTPAPGGANNTTPAPVAAVSSDSSDFPYPDVFFSFEQMRHGAFLLCIAGIVYMFAGLAIVCDDYFVPALEVLVDVLDLSEDVAGATFMAAGGSAPELFTSFIGVFVAKSNVGFGTIVGSAVFNILFVIGICAIATRDLDPKGLPLTWWPLFRDASFYSAALLLLTLFFHDHKIHWYESLILLLLYGSYVGFMGINERAKKKAWQLTGLKWNDLTHEMLKSDTKAWWENDEAAGVKAANSSNAVAAHGSAGTATELQEQQRPDNNVDSDEEDELWSPGWPTGSWKDRCTYVVLFPITFVLWLTVPRCCVEEKRRFYVWGFLGSIFWIAFLAYFMVWWAEVVSRAFEMPSTVMGLTILAAGTSVPDLITSVIVAKKGFGDMAVSSSIGSNMFDVTLGLPLPWFLWSIIHSEHVTVESNSLVASVIMLFLMLFATIGCIAAFGWRLNVILGGTSFLLYVVFVTVFLLIEYEVILD
eukprot:Rhum_TRINITY_DN4595_c0_g2::Rhum_TRINITY_DN4595_c0_g2_i1::g.14979::m.14979/K13750/SLC24A2, NCKX2; solute carrier family 24 (sodium/potassium/calcium exchanger), member 2